MHVNFTKLIIVFSWIKVKAQIIRGVYKFLMKKWVQFSWGYQIPIYLNNRVIKMFSFVVFCMHYCQRNHDHQLGHSRLADETGLWAVAVLLHRYYSYVFESFSSMIEHTDAMKDKTLEAP